MAAYSVEAEPGTSLAALSAIAEVHQRHEAPATFFIARRFLEALGNDCRAVLGHDLFDLECHIHTEVAPGYADLDQLRHELNACQGLIADAFGRQPIGLVTLAPCAEGFSRQKNLLEILCDCGIRFVRSDGLGVDGTVPSLFSQPYWYEVDEFGSLLELPLQYWDDRILRGHMRGVVAWPPVLPWGVPPAPPETPEEEFEIWRWGADYVIAAGLRTYQPMLHPWSICRLSSDARQIALLLEYVQEQGMEIVSCHELYERADTGQETFRKGRVPLPTAQAWRWRRPSLLSDGNHDARAPLHPIVGFAELLAMGAYGPLNEKQQTAADEILRCAERLAYVLEEMVTAEKLSARRIEAHLEPTSVEAIARQVCAEAENLSQGRANIEVRIGRGAEAVLTDEECLLELISCLLRNAIGFHPNDPEIDFAAQRADDRVYLELSDDGPGIPAHLGASAFRPLVREGDPRSGLPAGIGLGLTIASGFAQLLNGELRVKRTDGGTVFVIDLPAAEPPN